MISKGGISHRRLAIALGTLGVLSLLLCCGSGVTAMLLNDRHHDSPAFAHQCDISGFSINTHGQLPRIDSLGEEQIRNAAIIIHVGQQMKVPIRGWVIAIATALQESWLRNLPHLGEKNDHDSLGLFQQRPSTGWGTPEEILNPSYAATKFYEHLLKVPGWEVLPLTVAAQRVQISAFPDAYAKHEPLASQIVNQLANGAARCATGEISASGWTIPAKGPVVSGFRTAARPSHNGADIAFPHGTEVKAASSGTVTTMACNAIGPDGRDWGCDRDGGVDISGCGWYVDISHSGGILTRYCHLASRPRVSVGQKVGTGELIGWGGSSGNSSGPHLHFEVHTGGDSSSNGAVDPVSFMRDKGAPLGDER